MQTSSRAPKAVASSNGSRPPVERGRQIILQLLNRLYTPVVMRRLAVITSIGIIITYATGTLVTDSGSGHGCGQSWPLCRGQFIPQFAISTAIEFTHRVVVGLVSVLIIALAIGILWLWRSRRELLILALVMIPALVAEAGLGAALVLEPQSPLLLAVHFASSLILVASIVLATLIILELGSWDRLRDRPVPSLCRCAPSGHARAQRGSRGRRWLSRRPNGRGLSSTVLGVFRRGWRRHVRRLRARRAWLRCGNLPVLG